MEIGEKRANGGPCLDTVRALHQTVVALRAALEQSRSEILELKAKAWPLDSVENALRALSIENHVLRQKIAEENAKCKSPIKKQVTIISPPVITPKQSPVKKQLKLDKEQLKEEKVIANDVVITTEILSPRKQSRSLENLTLLLRSSPKKQLSISKTLSYSNISTDMSEDITKSDSNVEQNERVEVNDLEQEVDDIELIFTTDDTKEADFKEQLVSIDATDAGGLLPGDSEQNVDVSDKELEDDVFNDTFDQDSRDFKRDDSQLYNSKSDNSINHEDKSFKSYYSFQDSSFENKSLEKDESFDRFDDRVRIVETDISKCGIHDVEYSLGRRNTCPNPLQYRPIMHREALGRGLNVRKTRPILAHSNAVRRDSGAQTDISALPNSAWRSESSLANKVRVDENFTTLPSKYPLPGSRLRLSEKTVEARRVLLSDIGFTSMVPELSRSADYLCPGGNIRPPTTSNFGQFLRTPELYSPGFTSQKFTWIATTATPSEGSHSQSRYSSSYPLSPPVPSRRCSAPVSPSRRTVLKTTPSKVRFANGSLPELRGDWTTTVDSGDSTDSLVEEAENYLRRSIDCIVTGRDLTFSEAKKSVPRRASAPEPTRDNVPPQGWHPFLPRVPRDLRLDDWVKVISPEGRVRGGRVRYVGPLVTQNDQFVGVQLSTPDGHSDGTYSSRRYFQCEPYHGIFVPFKKVVMGWRP